MSEQLGLFGDPESGEASHPVGPATVAADLLQVAAHLPAGIHLGTSSWTFPGWATLVYDRVAEERMLAREGLAAYSQHPLLRCVGSTAPFTDPSLPPSSADMPSRFLRIFALWSRRQCYVLPRPFEANPARVPAHPGFSTPVCLTAIRRSLPRWPWASRGCAGVPISACWPGVEPTATGFCRETTAIFRWVAARSSVLYRAARSRIDYTGLSASVARGRGSSLHRFASAHAGVSEQARVTGVAHTGPLVVRWNLHQGLARRNEERYQPFRRLVDEDIPNRVSLARLCLQAVDRGMPAFVIANNKAEGSAPLTLFKLAEQIVLAAQHRAREA